MSSDERQPLLRNNSAERPGNGQLERRKSQLGPLEISASARYSILAGIWIATFLSSLNTTLVATLIPSISSEFNRSNQASWLGTAYLLATCTFTPLYGRLSNVLGRRGANQTAVIFAGLGTLACGLSTNMETLVVARFLSGIGGGGIFTTATIITSDMYSLRSRGLTQGVANIFNGLGMGLGGPIGGWVADYLGWRWAFLLQMPLFVVAFVMTSYNLRYATPGAGPGKSTKDIIKRIDYAGSLALLGSVLSFLIFLANKYNTEHSWKSAAVIAPLTLSGVLAIVFVIVELRFAVEPVMAPSLLRQTIPVLVSISNFLVAMCNFAIMYYFPMWFQTVLLTNASTAGLHLLPNSVSMSLGSLFAGWMMHRTGKYKLMNVICGIFPLIAGILIINMEEDSGPIQLWLSIIPLGFGNAVVLQTMLIALLAHLPDNMMAVGTGFGQLFRGIGQVGGVGVASAIFQSVLDRELRLRIHGDDELITAIRHSARIIYGLPPDQQRAARISYDIALKAVFKLAATTTGLAYLVRLPIPEKELDSGRSKPADPEANRRQPQPADGNNDTAIMDDNNDNDSEEGDEERDQVQHLRRPSVRSARRRLSTYESSESILAVVERERTEVAHR